MDCVLFLVVYSRAMLNRLLLPAFILLLSACAPQVTGRGHLDVTKKLERLPKEDAYKQDVLRLLGTPSTRSSFGDETWYYISAKRETLAFFKPETTEQNVVAIQFDANGKVTDIRKFDKKDGQDIALIEKTTPTEGREYGFWEQMLGNLGRFNGAGKSGTAHSVGGSPGTRR